MTDAGPSRFTIVPDDYHVPYAGTAGDGRKFFLSEELFSWDNSGEVNERTNYVAVFLWTADGEFDEIKVDAYASPYWRSPALATSADDVDGIVQARLAELG